MATTRMIHHSNCDLNNIQIQCSRQWEIPSFGTWITANQGKWLDGPEFSPIQGIQLQMKILEPIATIYKFFTLPLHFLYQYVQYILNSPGFKWFEIFFVFPGEYQLLGKVQYLKSRAGHNRQMWRQYDTVLCSLSHYHQQMYGSSIWTRIYRIQRVT